MQGIIFVYEAERSIKNRLFTVRIEARRKSGAIWVPSGPKRYYTAGDLQRSGLNFIAKELFSLAFRSETELRKQAGRFYAAEQEYTFYRISPYDLKAFLDGCFCSEALCREDGRPVHFAYVHAVVPEVSFSRAKEGYTPVLTLQGNVAGPGSFEMAADPVRIVSDTTVYELMRGVPAAAIRDLIRGRALSREKYERCLQTLSGYAGKMNLRIIADKQKRVIRRGEMTPVLDIDNRFQFARLGYRYADVGYLAMDDKRQVIFSPEKNIELHRNFKSESAWRRRLEKSGARFRSRPRGQWFIPARRREALLRQLSADGVEIRHEGAPLRLDVDFSWQLAVEDGALTVGGSVRQGTLTTDMENLLDAHLSGQLWFELPGGARGYIPSAVRQLLGRLEGRGDFKDDAVLFAPQDFAFVDDLFKDAGKVHRDPSFGAHLDLLQTMKQPDPQISVPAALAATLRPYQAVGFSWLRGLQRFGFGGILADDMGLGKSLQLLALLLDLKANSGGHHRTLLIVPKTLIWNWEAEIGKFASSLTLWPHTGPRRAEAADEGLSDADLVITSYGLARQDLALLTTIAWDLVVLDEAQAIKNPEAMTAKAVKRLPAKRRLALTGTPIENRPMDLWSLFDFLMPGFLGNRSDFSRTYASQDGDALASLGSLTAPFILRRMKKQVCRELPTKTEVTLLCDFEEGQKRCYEEILMSGRHQLAADADRPQVGPQRMQVLTLLLRLRQAACHPALVPGPGGCQGDSGKFEAIRETALEILEGGYKILIFSQFVAHLELVGESLARHGVELHTLYGSTPQRRAVIEGFKQSGSACVFLISLKVGGVGLNLTEAGYVFLLDPWWNPAIENQAIDRSYRIGQENPVTVYRFITKGSVEEKVSQLQARKQRMETAVLGQGDGGGVSERELLELIE